MNLIFEWCDYGDDFEAICDPPEDWMALDPDDDLHMFLWFKAYDVGMFERDRDERLAEEGFCYDCLVWVEFGWMGRREYLLENAPARSKEEAERILQTAANAIYEVDTMGQMERAVDMTKLIGFVWQHGVDDYSIWTVDLSDEDMKTVLEILDRYETSGYSVRGDSTLTIGS